MKLDELKFVLKENAYLKGGIKEACIKARDFLRHATAHENQVQSEDSCVSSDEFVEAVKTLIAFTFEHEDEVPETWYCDSDCKHVADLLCPGECNICEGSERRCPYFMDSSYI